MKQIILLMTLTLNSALFANTKIDSALQLENDYKGIAKTLAKIHLKNGPCDLPAAYTQDIVEATRKARRYFDTNWDWNKETGRKFKVDQSVLDALKSTLALKDIMNMLEYKNVKSYQKSLKNVIMWGPAPGAYGNISYIKFIDETNVELGSLDIETAQWQKTKGTFEVRLVDRKIVVDIISGDQVDSLILTNSYHNLEWHMVPLSNPKANPYMNGFVDYPSECEA